MIFFLGQSVNYCYPGQRIELARRQRLSAIGHQRGRGNRGRAFKPGPEAKRPDQIVLVHRPLNFVIKERFDFTMGRTYDAFISIFLRNNVHQSSLVSDQ